MPSVTVDAGAIASPLITSSLEEVYEYVDSLLDWRRLLKEPWVAIHMSGRASDALVEDGLYPLRDSLRALFAAKKIVEYDVNTVAQVTDTLLQLTPSFETIFKLKDVLCTDLTTEPDLLSINSTSGLKADLARCVVLIAVLRNHCGGPVTDHSLLLRHGAASCIVMVRAKIDLLDHERDDIVALPQAPELFEGSIAVCETFSQLVMSINETTVWNAATDKTGLELVLRIAVYKYRMECGLAPDWDKVGPFILGGKFFDTATECSSHDPDSLPTRLLTAMVETVEGINLRNTHTLRTGPGGNNPQTMRGEDGAWRRDIDYEYHLHYWKCSNDLIEFASVVPHNDFTIPK